MTGAAGQSGEAGNQGTVRGILWSLAAALTATALLALAKGGAGSLPILQITFVRYLTATLLIVPLTLYNIGPVPPAGRSVLLHFLGPAAGWNTLRALFALTRLSLLFYAMINMNFVNAQAINLTNAVFMVLFAWMLLGERLDPLIMGLGAVCLAGAALVAGQDIQTESFLPLPSLAALAAAVLWGAESIVIKHISTRDRHDRIVLGINLIALVLIAPFALADWQWTQDTDWLALGLIGPLAVLTQTFNLRAFRLTPANVLAPFRYAPILFSFLGGWYFFDELPGTIAAMGIVLILIGGIGVTLRVGGQKP